MFFASPRIHHRPAGDLLAIYPMQHLSQLYVTSNICRELYYGPQAHSLYATFILSSHFPSSCSYFTLIQVQSSTLAPFYQIPSSLYISFPITQGFINDLSTNSHFYIFKSQPFLELMRKSQFPRLPNTPSMF